MNTISLPPAPERLETYRSGALWNKEVILLSQIAPEEGVITIRIIRTHWVLFEATTLMARRIESTKNLEKNINHIIGHKIITYPYYTSRYTRRGEIVDKPQHKSTRS